MPLRVVEGDEFARDARALQLAHPARARQFRPHGGRPSAQPHPAPARRSGAAARQSLAHQRALHAPRGTPIARTAREITGPGRLSAGTALVREHRLDRSRARRVPWLRSMLRRGRSEGQLLVPRAPTRREGSQELQGLAEVTRWLPSALSRSLARCPASSQYSTAFSVSPASVQWRARRSGCTLAVSENRFSRTPAIRPCSCWRRGLSSD